jgi:Zn-dependent M28 family amino/carboxypeptidase
MVQTLDEFAALTPEQVAGRIVFFNYVFRQDLVNSFAAYGDAIKYRIITPMLVGAKGGAAVIIRSLSSGMDDAPHTGVTRYADTIRKIPAVAIGNLGAEKLAAACRKGTVTAQLTTSARMMDSVLSYNVIGELRGSTYPDEYIVVGGHLDSWDVGEGAQDDGAGCVQSIEVIRAFKASGIRPRRSVRAVLFMNEENGARGGRAYADSARVRAEKHILAIESDAGGFVPRGIGLEMDAGKKAIVKQWAPLFAPLNVYDFEHEHGGTDIDPLARLGTPLAGLSPDPQRYFDYHHTEQDVFEAVNHRELKLGAADMATVD